VWSSLEAAKLLVSILTPLTIVVLGFLFSRHLHKLESEKENARREQDARDQRRRDKLERRHSPPFAAIRRISSWT
jgi:Tfp pilus assembly protein PilO